MRSDSWEGRFAILSRSERATTAEREGYDREKLTFKRQCRYYRLTDVHGRVVKELFA